MGNIGVHACCNQEGLDPTWCDVTGHERATSVNRLISRIPVLNDDFDAGPIGDDKIGTSIAAWMNASESIDDSNDFGDHMRLDEKDFDCVFDSEYESCQPSLHPYRHAEANIAVRNWFPAPVSSPSFAYSSKGSRMPSFSNVIDITDGEPDTPTFGSPWVEKPNKVAERAAFPQHKNSDFPKHQADQAAGIGLSTEDDDACKAGEAEQTLKADSPMKTLEDHDVISAFADNVLKRSAVSPKRLGTEEVDTECQLDSHEIGHAKKGKC